MRITLGSLNKAKFSAVETAFRRHPRYADAEIGQADIPGRVDDQPMGMDMILCGANNRAHGAWTETHSGLGVGIESGLIDLPYSDSGWGDVTACVLYDGNRTYVGGSSIFEVPADIMDHILKKKLNLSEASQRAGYSKKENLGTEEGIIGVLTGGHVTRTGYTIQAIDMALIHLVRAWEQTR